MPNNILESKIDFFKHPPFSSEVFLKQAHFYYFFPFSMNVKKKHSEKTSKIKSKFLKYMMDGKKVDAGKEVSNL